MKVKRFVLLAVFFSIAEAFAQVPTNGLVAWYPLDGNANTVIGSSLNNGIITGANPTIGRNGQLNSAYYFNNSASTPYTDREFLIIPALSAMGLPLNLFSQDFSLLFYFKTQATDRTMLVFSVDSNGQDNNLNIELNDGFAWWCYWNGGGDPGIKSGPLNQLSTGEWHQFVLRRQGTRMQVLVDGSIKGCADASGVIGSNTQAMIFGLGDLGSLLPYGFNGSIDDIAFYDRCLTEADLGSFVVKLPFNGNALDASGHGNHGILSSTGNVTLTKDRFGNAASAYHFDSGGFISVLPLKKGTRPAEIFRANFTISFWIKSAFNKRAYALSIEDGAGDGHNLNIQFNDEKGCYPYWNSGGTLFLKHGKIGEFTDDTWHHILFQRSVADSNVELFIDGTRRDSKAAGPGLIGSNNSTIHFGRNILSNYNLQDYYWSGEIDDIEIYNRTLSTAEINLLANDGLITNMSFTGGAYDESGLTNEVILGSADNDSANFPVLTTDRFGNCNSAYSFNGKGYVQIKAFAKNCALQDFSAFDEDFTISFWTKTAANNRMYAFSIDEGLGKNNLNIEYNHNAGATAYWNSSGASGITTGTTGRYADGSWHHNLFRRTKSKNIIELFIDGELKGSVFYGAGTVGSNIHDIIIGYNTSNGFADFGWRGIIDDVQLYNRALSDSEVHKLTSVSNDVYITIKRPGYSLQEKWAVGSKHTISWITGRNAVVDLEYFDGAAWKRIKAGISSDAGKTTNYLWKVPTVSGPVRFRVIDEVTCRFDQDTVDILPSAEKDCYAWKSINPSAPFVPRDGAGALVYNNNMWLIGGWNPGVFTTECTNDVWKSKDGYTWDEVQPYTVRQYPNSVVWEYRHTAGYVVHKNEMWILGGDPMQRHYQNDLWKSVDGVKWTQVTPQGAWWTDRVLHYSVAFNNKMWVMGGQKLPQFVGATEEAFYNDVWNSDNGVSWNKMPDAPWSARGMIMGSAVLGGRIWVIGGGTYETPANTERKFYNDVWSTADGITWKQHITHAPWDARQYHNVIVYDNKLWVIAGYDDTGTNRKDVWYSTDGENWYEVENTPWPERHATSLFVINKGLYVVTGNNMQSDVWKLSCPSDTLPSATAPNGLKLFPNPASSIVTISSAGFNQGTLTIIDALGRTVKSEKFSTGPLISVNVDAFKAGVYFVEIKDEKQRASQKFVVQY